MYQRTIGRWVNGRGAIEAKKFYLGRDEQQARFAVVLLEKLWADVEASWELFEGWGERLNDIPDYHDPRPRWTAGTSLVLAEAAAKGQTRATFGRRRGESDDDYLGRMILLRQNFPTITAMAGDEQTWQALADRQLAAAERLSERVRYTTRMFGDVEHDLTGQRLYDAIDAYADWAQERNPKEGGRQDAAHGRA